MARNKGNHDIASHVRGAFLMACKSSEARGRSLSTIIENLLTDDPKGCLDTVAKFVPREMLIETTIVEQLDEMSDEAVTNEIKRLAAEASALLTVEGAAGKTQH